MQDTFEFKGLRLDRIDPQTIDVRMGESVSRFTMRDEPRVFQHLIRVLEEMKVEARLAAGDVPDFTRWRGAFKPLDQEPW